VFGLAGKWVPAELRHQADLAGATVVDRASVVITHLAEVVRSNASRLLGREDVRALTDVVKRTHPVVVEELTPAALSLGQVQRVLQSLLDEGLPIRDLVRIFEALSLAAKTSIDPDSLVDAARSALGPAVAARYATDGTLAAFTFDPRLEQSMLEALRATEHGLQLSLDSVRAEAMVAELTGLLEAAEQIGATPVLVCSPRLPVLSYTEIAGCALRIETMGVVGGAYPVAA
jgi:flagellar biosynthesis protein FlhA